MTPLLAARINRGIEIYRNNPGSKIIMSGGQGPGEEIPEAAAMAKYAEERESLNKILLLKISQRQLDKI